MKYNLERFARTKLPGHMGMYTKIVMKCLTRPDKVGAFNLYPDDEIQEPMPDETRQQKISLSKRYLEEVCEVTHGRVVVGTNNP